MNWESLLSLKRYGDQQQRSRAQQDELRLGYDVDYDRVIFSQHFRSLQDKTQVIPLSQTSFVHTRLTHSLEVSVVARSLGRMVGAQLLKKYDHLKTLGYKSQDVGAIVAAAALAHDIGNPPFGHSGEKAIGAFFTSENGRTLISSLSRKQQQDLLHYEGNANGYRLLNRDTPGTPGGLRLSYATLGAFVKYPKESLPIKPSAHVSQKKFGIFQADLDHFKDVAQTLGLENKAGGDIPYHRHPLAFLVEAADDICYNIIDFEDGVNLGWISEEFALEYFINLVRPSIKKEIYVKLATTAQRLGYLRALAINNLITDCVTLFMKHEEAMLQGSFTKSLTDLSSYKVQLDDILKITIEKVYQHKEVIDKEIAGYKIISTILEALVTAVIHDFNNEKNSYDTLILQACNGAQISKNTLYEGLLDTCGFVASLTDGQAAQLYNTFNGHI